MRDAARLGYAQARIQARFGGRPAESFWRELEAGRALPHVVEIVRASPLAAAVEAMPAGVDPHSLEARLRQRWLEVVDEIANWYPDGARPAFRWLGWLPWLAGLTWLARGRQALPWMRADPLIGELADAERSARSDTLREGLLAPLAAAFGEEGGSDVAGLWHRHWRRTWPALGADRRPALVRLDAAVSTIMPGEDADPAPGFDALVGAAEAAVTRLFRRHAGTAVAGLALLALLRLDHMRLRAALATARLFGEERAA